MGRSRLRPYMVVGKFIGMTGAEPPPRRLESLLEASEAELKQINAKSCELVASVSYWDWGHMLRSVLAYFFFRTPVPLV
jgi:hypothetical protein